MAASAKRRTPLVYTSSDYSGQLNLLAVERALVLESCRRYGGHREAMAEALEVTSRTLYRLIYCHGLKGIFSSQDRNILIINELDKIKKEYPDLKEYLKFIR